MAAALGCGRGVQEGHQPRQAAALLERRLHGGQGHAGPSPGALGDAVQRLQRAPLQALVICLWSQKAFKVSIMTTDGIPCE